MRAVLCYGATERNGGREEARRGLAECQRFLASNERALVRGAVGLHAGFTVSDETLREAGALARDLGAVLHLHVAEDELDVADARRRGHAGALARLIALDALPSGSILAHGVHLSEDEVLAASGRGAWIVQNPRSNRANGVGYPRALGASGRVALGTDGFPADMIDEAEALILAAAAHGEDMDRAVARLRAGQDLVAERFGESARAGAVVALGSVVIGDRTVVRDGELVSADLEEIRAHAREAAGRLWARMEAL